MNPPLDTLVCDSLQIAGLQQNPDYDYNRELVRQDETLWDMFVSWFRGWWREWLHNATTNSIIDAIYVVIAVVTLGLIVWFLYRYRPELFMRRKRLADNEEEEEETIYGIDFDQEISRALKSGNHRQAVRYLYLKTLRRLSDTSRIDWQPSKTPSQYVREHPSEPFRLLTQHFLRVRYGNFKATPELFDEMRQLAEKGGWL